MLVRIHQLYFYVLLYVFPSKLQMKTTFLVTFGSVRWCNLYLHKVFTINNFFDTFFLVLLDLFYIYMYILIIILCIPRHYRRFLWFCGVIWQCVTSRSWPWLQDSYPWLQDSHPWLQDLDRDQKILKVGWESWNLKVTFYI